MSVEDEGVVGIIFLVGFMGKGDYVRGIEGCKNRVLMIKERVRKKRKENLVY